MKPLFLISILCCLLAPLSHALTFNGQVTDARTGQPVAYLAITVQDSLNQSQSVSVRTTITGAYSVNWPGTPTLNTSFRISTGNACGSPQQVYARYSGANPVTTNFSVCLGSANYRLQGRAVLPSSSASGAIIVDVLSIVTTQMGTDSVSRRDSFSTAANGSFNKLFPYIPSGRILLKASLPPGHSAYGKYLPTYFTTFPSWATATNLSSSAFIVDTLLTVTLIDTIQTSGPGMIGGVAVWGGAPADNRIIILTNANNRAIGFTYTDFQGRFAFNNLALGTYKVHGDVLVKLNTALTMTLTSTKPTIPNLVFEETNTVFVPRLGTLGVSASGNNVLDQLLPAPNPVQRAFGIPGAEKIGGAKELSVHDLSGRLISRLQFEEGQQVRIDGIAWPAGMYFLQLQTGIGSKSYRIVKE